MFEQLAARAEDAPAQRERITAALSELGAELGAAHQQRLRDLAGVSAAQVDTLATESARQIAARLELVARGLLQDPPA
jgi:hypothetical protein